VDGFVANGTLSQPVEELVRASQLPNVQKSPPIPLSVAGYRLPGHALKYDLRDDDELAELLKNTKLAHNCHVAGDLHA